MPEEQDWWKHQPEEEPDIELPELYTATGNHHEDVRLRAEELCRPANAVQRKRIEAYMRVKEDPIMRRKMLLLFLDLEEIEPLDEPDCTDPYTWPDEELIDLLSLESEMEAIEMLRAEGR